MWMRRVQIIVTQKDDPSKQVVFEKHRIDFEVRSTVGWPADTANITIFNLSLDEIKFLQSKQFGDMYIEIRAGYRGTAEQVLLVEFSPTWTQVNTMVLNHLSRLLDNFQQSSLALLQTQLVIAVLQNM